MSTRNNSHQKIAKGPSQHSVHPAIKVIIALLGVAAFVTIVLLIAHPTGIEVSGEVRDAVTNRPIANAIVFAGKERVTTDERGQFTITLNELPDFFNIIAEGYESVRVPARRRINLKLPPSPRTTVERWWEKWRARKYESMYNDLTKASRAELSKDEFVTVFKEHGRYVIDLHVERAEVKGNRAIVPATLTVRTIFGERTLQEPFYLEKEGGVWKIVWSAERGVTPRP